jgi:UDP:flavonoid glycosyltransferase YjiC (YdhE family)
MRVLAACSLGGAGHLEPLLPFLDAAHRRGDDVRVIAPPALDDMVRRAGHVFVSGGEPAQGDVASIRERLPVASPAEASVLGNRDLFARMAAAAMLPATARVCAEWQPDLVLRDPCEYASAVVAGASRIPLAQVALSLAEVESGSIDVAAPELERHRAGLVAELRASPYLSRFPASVDPSPFPNTLRYHVPGAATQPLPEWWHGSDAPLVYVTFGSVLPHMTIAGDVFRTALEAVAALRVRTLLTVGRASRFDPTDLGAVPASTRIERWVDQARVLPSAAVVVCHGGSGTVLGALAAGVPTVLVPVFADQFENARRVVGRGAGVAVEVSSDRDDDGRNVISRADAPRITAAIETVLDDRSYRRRARALAAEMAAAPSATAVLDRLHADIDAL